MRQVAPNYRGCHRTKGRVRFSSIKPGSSLKHLHWKYFHHHLMVLNTLASYSKPLCQLQKGWVGSSSIKSLKHLHILLSCKKNYQIRGFRKGGSDARPPNLTVLWNIFTENTFVTIYWYLIPLQVTPNHDVNSRKGGSDDPPSSLKHLHILLTCKLWGLSSTWGFRKGRVRCSSIKLGSSLKHLHRNYHDDKLLQNIAVIIDLEVSEWAGQMAFHQTWNHLHLYISHY